MIESGQFESMQNTVTEVSPLISWEALKSDKRSVLVDVRTMAEWSYVGIADLSDLEKAPLLLEWMQLPKMALNEQFLEQLSEQLAGVVPSSIYFLCRSGVRSLQAAHATADLFSARGQSVGCVNIIGGFEGDLDSKGHRGNTNGWKVDSLPWRQT